MPRISACQACESEALESFYRVPSVPVHTLLMIDDRQQAIDFPRGEIDLVVCHDCGFIQNAAFDPAQEHYSTAYEETQAFSPRFIRFLEELCDDQIRKFALEGKTALEIGCGKGEFLAMLCERGGCRGIGLDPAYRPERLQSAAAERLTFIQDFYGPKYLDLAADYIACRHTLEHIQDVLAFMRMVRRSIGDRPQVDVFFELPDMERILVEGAFWDIYYEHCSYFTGGSLARVFRRAGFDVHNIWKGYDDQYVMVEATPASGPTTARLLEEDDLARTLAQVEDFRRTVRRRLDTLGEQVRRWRAEGQRIAIWGSGSKGISLLTTLGLNEEIAAVIDINPHKHGKFLTGTGHEIEAPAALVDLQPGVVIVMNPIYVEEIRADLLKLGLSPQLVAV